ncbi:hypothetical protein [Sulfurimonas sp.]|uniref:hypothetical protein n=1 Tax=Sulfurimonas sp. TaxID=2022749 RepID=UPI002AB10395|nr:hypothetical protein [Sulfurimonas sp.]
MVISSLAVRTTSFLAFRSEPSTNILFSLVRSISLSEETLDFLAVVSMVVFFTLSRVARPSSTSSCPSPNSSSGIL